MADLLRGKLHLLSLPVEVRTSIYDVLFQQPFRVVVGSKLHLGSIDDTSQSSQLLETCRQIHDEAILFLYRKLSIRVTQVFTMFNLRETMPVADIYYVEKISVTESNSPPEDWLWYALELPPVKSRDVHMSLSPTCLDEPGALQSTIQKMVPEIQKGHRAPDRLRFVERKLHFYAETSTWLWEHSDSRIFAREEIMVRISAPASLVINADLLRMSW
jgi:hypothetical protein